MQVGHGCQPGHVLVGQGLMLVQMDRGRGVGWGWQAETQLLCWCQRRSVPAAALSCVPR